MREDCPFCDFNYSKPSRFSDVCDDSGQNKIKSKKKKASATQSAWPCPGIYTHFPYCNSSDIIQLKYLCVYLADL